MKAILEFNLPDDQEDFERAVNAWKLEVAINEYSQKLRSMYKHEDIGTIDTYDARKMLFDIFAENGADTEIL